MKRPWVLHPSLLGLFAVLFLFGRNMQWLALGQVIPPAIVVLAGALVLLLLLTLPLRDVHKAGVLASLLVLSFFSYGRILAVIQGKALWGVVIGKQRYLVLFFALLIGACTAYLLRTRHKLDNITRLLNVMTAALLMISVVNIVPYQLQKARAQGADLEATDDVQQGTKGTDDLPNIYYIILDGYARQDVLRDLYAYDNSPFLDHLRGKGFFVAERARSNYCQTSLSLASSLNYSYLDKLAARVGYDANDRAPLQRAIANSAVVRTLRAHGYHIVAFASGYADTELRNADRYISMAGRWMPDAFEQLLLNTTPIPYWAYWLEALPNWADLHRKRLLATLDALPEAAGEQEGPVFVFAHIVAPHPPFIFGPQGEEIEPVGTIGLSDGDHLVKPGLLEAEEYRRHYRDQLAFISRRVQGMVDALLANASRPTVILLQADHGPGSSLHWEDPAATDVRERLAILSAYYFPDGQSAELYEDITPVNTFRVLLNHYLGTNYPLLEDRSYFSRWKHPYEFLDVTERVTGESIP